jgi:hypothetical protein
MLGFVVITAVNMKSMVFWVATRCSSEKSPAYRLHLCGRRVRNLSLPPSVGFLLGLLLYNDDGGDMFLRNVGLSPYTAFLFMYTYVHNYGHNSSL